MTTDVRKSLEEQRNTTIDSLDDLKAPVQEISSYLVTVYVELESLSRYESFDSRNLQDLKQLITKLDEELSSFLNVLQNVRQPYQNYADKNSLEQDLQPDQEWDWKHPPTIPFVKGMRSRLRINLFERLWGGDIPVFLHDFHALLQRSINSAADCRDFLKQAGDAYLDLVSHVDNNTVYRGHFGGFTEQFQRFMQELQETALQFNLQCDAMSLIMELTEEKEDVDAVQLDNLRVPGDLDTFESENVICVFTEKKNEGYVEVEDSDYPGEAWKLNYKYPKYLVIPTIEKNANSTCKRDNTYPYFPMNVNVHTCPPSDQDDHFDSDKTFVLRESDGSIASQKEAITAISRLMKDQLPTEAFNLDVNDYSIKMENTVDVEGQSIVSEGHNELLIKLNDFESYDVGVADVKFTGIEVNHGSPRD